MSAPELDAIRAHLAALRAEMRGLTRWKAEATEVISAWEAIHGDLGEPGALGESKAAATRAEVKRLTAERDALMRASFAAYEASGADTDGDEQWHCTPEWAGSSLIDAVTTLKRDYDELLDESESAERERDEARAALAALVAWVADEIGYPVQMVMGPPIPAAAWPVLVDHVHADASGNWHGNTLDREDTEAWLADEAGIDLAAVLANHPTTKEAER